MQPPWLDSAQLETSARQCNALQPPALPAQKPLEPMLHANPPIRSLPLWLLPLLLMGLLDPCHCEICTAALRKLHSGRDPTVKTANGHDFFTMNLEMSDSHPHLWNTVFFLDCQMPIHIFETRTSIDTMQEQPWSTCQMQLSNLDQSTPANGLCSVPCCSSSSNAKCSSTAYCKTLQPGIQTFSVSCWISMKSPISKKAFHQHKRLVRSKRLPLIDRQRLC